MLAWRLAPRGASTVPPRGAPDGLGTSAVLRCLLLALLVMLVLLGRTVIGFNEVEAAIEEDMAALGGAEQRAPSCTGVGGTEERICEACCCNVTTP